jgi:hypothetical protein
MNKNRRANHPAPVLQATARSVAGLISNQLPAWRLLIQISFINFP